MQAAIFDDDTMGSKYSWEPIPAELRDKCVELRESMIEACADVDDGIMEKFLAGKIDEVTPEEIYAALRKGTCSFKFVPVVCGSAFKNKGVQLLLDAVVNFLPSPIDIPPVTGVSPDDESKKLTRKADDDEPFAALAFKIMNDPFVGNLTFFRIYSGTLTSGTAVLNSTRGKR
jgi:elongation factor G